MRALTRDEVRDVDRRAAEEFGMPGILLMENAGRGCAELLLELDLRGRVVICCGRGNNGGDGFVIARHLDNAGVDVLILLFAAAGDLRGDAAVNLQIVRAAGIPLQECPEAPADLAEQLASADWIVDALLGTGSTGDVREPVRTVIDAINRSGRRVLAIDLPSGMDCDTGEPLGRCVAAEHTATMVAPKQGFENPAARAWTGEVQVIDIGVPRRLLTYFDP